jgi:hypothetical protein
VERSLPMPKASLSDGELRRCWEELVGNDARRAFRASWLLAAAGRPAVGLIAHDLRPVTRPNQPVVTRLLKDLAEDSYDVRAKAELDLENLGEAVAIDLRKSLTPPVSLDFRRRIERLLSLIGPNLSPAAVRDRRATAVLERIGTPEARALLESVAGGAPGARRTRDAKACLERLAKRAPRASESGH